MGAVGAGIGTALVGLREGAVAGSGGLSLFKRQVESEHGTGSLAGSMPMLNRLDRFASRLDPLPGQVLETLIGGAAGGVGLWAALEHKLEAR